MNDNLLKRGLRLEYMTLGWNVVGTAVVVVAAVMAGSVAVLAEKLIHRSLYRAFLTLYVQVELSSALNSFYATPNFS